MIERQAHILEYATGRERVNVPELSDLFDVSQVTIRKDLDHLEHLGLIERSHGYARVNSTDDMRGRLAVQYDLKQRIARQAVELVADAEFVMIESGSCCALLAAEIATQRQGCTIVTNSAFIAGYIRDLQAASSTAVVLLGGDYQPESQVTVGALAEQAVAGFFVNRLFIGIDGYTADTGFTGRNLQRANVVRAMARQAGEVVVLTESAKFSHRGAVRLLPDDGVRRVVTDSGLPQAMRELLAEAGTAVDLVDTIASTPSAWVTGAALRQAGPVPLAQDKPPVDDSSLRDQVPPIISERGRDRLSRRSSHQQSAESQERALS